MHSKSALGSVRAKKTQRDSFELDEPEAIIGLSYTRKLGTTTARADRARASSTVRQLRYAYDNEFVTLLSRARSLVARMEQLEAVLVSNKKQIEAAQGRTAEELALYEQGRGELNFVLESQDSEQNARFQYVENGALYRGFYMQFLELTDRLWTD